ncbi:hypothetical protein FJZ17_02085 [Candidatus Pacearchaeota archaeon]|nr:hypothetical protein [Candidatus Pacearchaeota archaeon]
MVKKQKNKSKVSAGARPLGVSILAVLSYIAAVFTFIGGLAMLIGSTAVSTIIGQVFPEYVSWSTAGVALFVFLGIVFILLGVLDFFIGKGLWNGKEWARILVLIFLALSVIDGVLPPFAIVQAIIAALLIWYLGFNPAVKRYFK